MSIYLDLTLIKYIHISYYILYIIYIHDILNTFWEIHLRYCYDDYSLDEAAASYYSPYKLKASMAGRPEMSTSCSFGMMAGLSRVGLTDSPCASILVGEQGTKAKNAARHQNHQSGKRLGKVWKRYWMCAEWISMVGRTGENTSRYT